MGAAAQTDRRVRGLAGRRASVMAGVALALGLLPWFRVTAAGAQSQLFTVERYLDLEQVGDARIAPDGKRVIFTRSHIDRLKDRWSSMLWLMDGDGGRQRQLVEGSNPAWSPDGDRIAYLAPDGDGRPQLWIRYMDDEGAVVQVTRVTEAPGAFTWSPDGRWLAFTMLVPTAPELTITLPSAPDGATWVAPPDVVSRLHYRADRTGDFRHGWTQLFVVQAEGGTPRQVTRDGFNVGVRFDGIPETPGLSWLADGNTIVFDGDADPDADRHYLVSNLYAVDVASGATRVLTTEAGYWHGPVQSPDGKWIAFTGFPKTSNSYLAENLYIIHPDGTGLRQLSTGFDRDPAGVRWADNETLWFTADDQGTSNTFTVAIKGGGVKPASNGLHMLALGDISGKGGYGIATRSAPTAPSELVRFPLRKPWDLQALTRVNEDLVADLRLGETEELDIHAADGTKLQGWLVKPPGFNPAQTYPLILEIHGGPHGMYGLGFSPSFQNFAAAGYLVLFMNPRGSTGYGTAFGNAIEKNYPGVDYGDLMAAVDQVIGQGSVDTTRMYVGGCSGGGVLSSWVIGHTNRFAAAAVRCPVTDWIAFAGQSDVPLFTYDFFARPFWEDPTEWFNHSPLKYVGNVRTPTLLMTGKLDLRTPIAQTEEFYAALKVRGVPATMIRFNDEYHGTGSRPSNWMRTQLYMLAWYGRWPAKP